MVAALSDDAVADLDSMTKAELLEFAETNGIGGVSSSMRKAEIYAAIAEALEAD